MKTTRNPNLIGAALPAAVAPAPPPAPDYAPASWTAEDCSHEQHAKGHCLLCRHATAWHDERGWCGVCSDMCAVTRRLLGEAVAR